MRMGIDLGGTKMEVVAMDQMGEVRGRIRVSTPQEYPDIIAGLVKLRDRLEREVGPIQTIGVGTPGCLCPHTGLIKNAYNTALQGHMLDRDLEVAMKRPIRVANDANCFALSEATDGAGAEQDVVVGVILGTGVGAGLVINGKVLHGRNAIAGEWGHNPLPGIDADGERRPVCTCGRRGCIEAYLSGPAMRRDHLERTGADISAKTIANLAEAGDEEAQKTLERYGDRLARALAAVINFIDPDVIVLGGGVSQIPALYRHVKSRWGEHVFSDRVDTELLPNRFGDSSGVRGAAWLWSRDLD
ncbi:ROK [Plesiocystis pacifica SIR-1]|uniref:ROK n=1 Tax=Plesiocystis pacifica SIR-1 TaxID=391625 RepID=A6GIW1_9BACT|nr:ROK family protein [Plesiocystis pacifica]EDM74196.1 ROK [Plesiocystis pacifica SIR-1]